jgi:FkbM family methyltransferase
MNGLDNRILPFPFAIVDSVRSVDFWLGPSGAMGKADGSAGRKDVVYSECVSVEGISLDSFVYDNNNPAPQVVKMDIEGGEVLALPGMRRILEKEHPILLLELHGFEAAQVAWEILHGSGYRISKMAPLYPVVQI